MVQTALKGHLMLAGDDFSDRLMSDRGKRLRALDSTLIGALGGALTFPVVLGGPEAGGSPAR